MPSLKQIGTICFVFSFVFLSTKSYSDIAANNSNPSCDNSTLNTYTGPAALEAKWNANEIPLRWYNNNTLMDTTTQESTCEYDDDITVPSVPSRTGYDFAGWTVRPERSFDTLKTASYMTGQKLWAKGREGSNNCYVASNGDATSHTSCDTDSTFFELQYHEWKVESDKGTIYGMAYCSGKAGNNHNWTWGG